jgi:lysophospholipase L1-like esterase
LKRLKPKVLTTSIVVSAVAVVVLGAEAVLRYRESRRVAAGAATPQQYYRHRRLGRALVRNTGFPGRMHINRYGFRGPDFQAQKAPGTIRILAVGFSATFSPCASNDSTAWPARLQRWLEASAPGRRFEVINAGVSGSTMLDLIIRMQTELYAFAPDVVLLYSGHGVISDENLAPTSGEAALAPGSDTPDAMPTVTPWGDWLQQHSLLYERIAERASAYLTPKGRERGIVEEKRWEEALSRGAADFRHDLRAFVLVARGAGARVVLVEAAHFSGSTPAKQLSPADEAEWRAVLGQPAELLFEGYRRFAAVSQAVADSLDATFIPTGAFGIAGRELYCPRDPIHFNDAGADLMGRRLAEALLASKALPFLSSTGSR